MEEEKKNELEETESVPVNEKSETIHFPWAMAIIIGVLMVIIIALFVTIMILEPFNPFTSSVQNSSSLL